MICGEVASPGVVKPTGIAKIIMGPWPQQASDNMPDALLALFNAFKQANVPRELSDNIQKELWKKLIINNGVNTLSAITELDTVEATNPGHFNWANWFTLAGVTAPAQQSWAEFPTWELGINAVLTGDRVVALAPQSLVEELIKTKRLVNPFPIALEPGLNFSLLYNPNSPRM